MTCFKILSSNIRFDNPHDGDHIWPNRKPVLSKLINSFSLDLLGTQEGRRPQLKDLEESLDSLQLVEQHRQWIPERMYPSFFIPQNGMELINSGDFWLSETPHIPGSSSFESQFPRLCTWLKFKSQGHGPFMVANVHLDHAKTSTRKHQAEVLCREILRENSHSLPLILMGDFNEGPEGDVMKIIQKNIPTLSDAWKSIHQEETPSHHKFGQRESFAKRIDWILLDKIFEVHQVKLDTSNHNQIYPSDHYPLYCEVSFKNLS